MNSREYQEIQKAYFEVYEIDEANTVMSVSSPSGKSKPLNITKAKPAKNLEGQERLAAARDIRQQDVNRRAPEIEKRIKGRYGIREKADLYDVILSHLLDEGYADTLEAAEGIMESMSEEWKQSIMERDAEPGEEDDSPDVRAHNRSLKDKTGKKLYPSGRAGNARRPDPSKDPRYGSQY